MIEALMCDFRIDGAEVQKTFGVSAAEVTKMLNEAENAFEGLLRRDGDTLFVPQEARPLTRMIARQFDAYDLSKAGHSSAI